MTDYWLLIDDESQPLLQFLQITDWWEIADYWLLIADYLDGNWGQGTWSTLTNECVIGRNSGGAFFDRASDELSELAIFCIKKFAQKAWKI